MHEYRAKITKIVDGDTIKCDIDLGFSTILANQTIRLYGIDTPESRTRDKEEKYYGKLSAAFLQDKCPKGSYITLRTHLDKKGKFGRILGEIIVDNINLNQQMIEENLAGWKGLNLNFFKCVQSFNPCIFMFHNWIRIISS